MQLMVNNRFDSTSL